MGMLQVTTALGGVLIGRYPEDASKNLGPRMSVKVGQSGFMRGNWADVNDDFNQFVANPSPKGLNFIARVQPRKNVKTTPNAAPNMGTSFVGYIAKPYSFDPVIAQLTGY